MKTKYDLSTLNRRYTFSRQLVTNITLEYVNDTGSKWTALEMIRESVQNMLDEALYQARNKGGDISDYYKLSLKRAVGGGKFLHVTHFDLRDYGRGVDLEAIFFLGASGKRGSDYKGHKGEGEVLSFLVAAREGIDKWMFSKKWAAQPVIVEAGGYKVLALNIYETNLDIEGTVWRYEWCPQVEKIHSNLPHYFPELSKREMKKEETRERKAEKDRDKRNARNRKEAEKIVRAKSTISTKVIMTPRPGKPACLYVKGVYVKELRSLFSYNIDVEINRDRSMVDDMAILEKIQEAWLSNDLTEKQCIEYWSKAASQADLLEYKQKLNFSTNIENFSMMRQAFTKVFGKKAFIPTVPVATLDAETIGWKRVKLPTNVEDTALALSLDTDKSVMGYIGDVIPLNFNSTQEKLIKQLKKIANKLGFKDYTVEGAKKSLAVTNDSVKGLYSNGKITLFETTLNGNRLELLSTYLHEVGHGESRAGDGTRAFTDWFEKLLIEVFIGKHDHVRPLIEELLKIK